MAASLFDRRDYPTLRHHRYLNQASLGLMGSPAVDAMRDFVENVGRHGNCFMTDADEVACLDALRAVAAELLGCPPAQLAIVNSASEILAQLPLLLDVPAGRHALAFASDFPAITRPWLRQQQLGACEVRFVEDRAQQDPTHALLERIDADTAVVAISSVQYATGTLLDIDAVSRAAKAVGARLIVDVTQALGARPVDAGRWNADAVVCSGYKWLGGHGGVAIAALSPDLLRRPPPMTGWMGAPQPFAFDARSLLLADDARRYTQSTMSYASVSALTAAIRPLLAVGADAIEAHARDLSCALAAKAADKGWRPWRPPTHDAASAHILTLAHPEQSAEQARVRLAERRVVCGERGGRLRVSLAPYNDSSDVDALIDALD